ncbi:hypothetical protein N7532_010519 [Penicillium argentinense]|uniref:Uncharacterized protein n=1 Tax=Penicillium argentinense TaxID=1131581 RepID=A0A9W9EPR0_9EURO|nr:uncharacterized protein N7532_010519 [Penicillium argentinense]KAJ5085748.1 hypothetical protein N7532_010519 [Penicillium argentinense]
MPLCTLLQRYRQSSRSNSRPPLMDLSSLEGPPIEDPRVVVTPEPIARLRIEPPTPDTNTHPSRLWKSLPPRPSSADPTSPSRHTHLPRPLTHRFETSQSEANDEPYLRRAPAQRGRRTPSPDQEELNSRNANLNLNLNIDTTLARHSASSPYERSRSPLRTPVSLEAEAEARWNLETLRDSERGRRARSCCPLVWVESERRWVVFGPYRQPASGTSTSEDSAPRHRTPGPPPDLSRRPAYPEIYTDLLYADNEIEPADHPPTYESHGFSPTHVDRLGGRRWSSVARRWNGMGG